MKARNIYLLLAKDVITDPVDNMNTLVKIIDKFTSRVDESMINEQNSKLQGGQTTAVPVQYVIASAWAFDQMLAKPTLVTTKMNIVDPNGKDLGGPEQEQEFPAKIDKVNLNFKSDALPITKSGRYILKAKLLSKKGEELANAEYSYEVELIKPS